MMSPKPIRRHQDARDILVRFPGPVTLRGERRWFSPAVETGALLFVTGIFSRSYVTQLPWLAAGLAAAVPAIAAELLLPIRLTLSAWGFDERAGPLRQARRWGDVGNFTYVPASRARLSSIAFDHLRTPPLLIGVVGSSDLKPKGSLYECYDIGGEKLAVLLNDWRMAALGSR